VVFIVSKVVQGQVFLLVIWLSPVSIIPPAFHNHLHLHIALTRRTNRRIWELSKTSALSDVGERWTRKVLSIFLVFEGFMDNVKSVHMPVNQ